MNFENESEVDALARVEALAVLMAAGREYDAGYIEACIEAAGCSVHDLWCQVERESRERVCSVFATMGYEFNGNADDESGAEESGAESELKAGFSDHCDSFGRRLWDFEGYVPAGTTAVVYHEGRKIGEAKTSNGHFEIQAAMPRGLQTVEVLAIRADGRELGSSSCVFKVE